MNKKLLEFNERLKKSKIAIIGLGVSNMPLIDYLHELSCDVTIFSDNEIDESLLKYDYQVYMGNDALSHLKGFDIIFRSPGCLPTRYEILSEIERGAYVTTEVSEVLKLSPCKIIGVTGSDGKTTTTTLIDLVLKECGYKTYLGGNIGTPLFTKIEEMNEDDIVILELSSFQLMDMDVSPNVSVITNISPNHLDKHKDYQEYIDSKLNIYKHGDGILVLNGDDEILKDLESNREIRYFSRYNKTNGFYYMDGYIWHDDKKIIDVKKIKMRGIHNYENICACLSAVYHMIDVDKAVEVICQFVSVPHRLEFVREIDGVKWYNDSVSSSPSRTIAGLESFSEDIVLIAGGYDKNLDYQVLVEPILKKVSKLILFGSTSDKIYTSIKDTGRDSEIEIYLCDNLSEVIYKAKEVSIPGEVVLFSPGSASFDMFKDFADRGIKFKDLVNKL